MNDTDFRKARATLGLTQEQLAENLGMCVRQVIRYEHGERRIPGPVEIAVKHFLMVAKKVG